MHEKSDAFVVVSGVEYLCTYRIVDVIEIFLSVRIFIYISFQKSSFDVNAFRSLKLNYKPKQFQMNMNRKKTNLSEDDGVWKRNLTLDSTLRSVVQSALPFGWHGRIFQ